MFVDSHCHLDRLKQSPKELAETLNFARARGVEHFLCVCVSVGDYDSMLEAVSGFDDVSVSCGVHPLHQDEACSYEVLLEKAKRKEVVAIGETGLDYFYSPESKDVQLTSFVDHIKVANETNKPLIIHTRDAREDTINLLREHKAPHTRGVLHCFTESLEMAQAAIDMDFYISISGIITFKNANELQDTFKSLPLDKILIETDGPFLAPVPNRGKKNEPSFIDFTATKLAEIKEISKSELIEITTSNFNKLFSN